jgi:hypothetical protein
MHLHALAAVPNALKRCAPLDIFCGCGEWSGSHRLAVRHFSSPVSAAAVYFNRVLLGLANSGRLSFCGISSKHLLSCRRLKTQNVSCNPDSTPNLHAMHCPEQGYVLAAALTRFTTAICSAQEPPPCSEASIGLSSVPAPNRHTNRTPPIWLPLRIALRWRDWRAGFAATAPSLLYRAISKSPDPDPATHC